MATMLNKRAWELAEKAVESQAELRIDVVEYEGGARVLDFGVEATGSLAAGLLLAKICAAGKAEVSLQSGQIGSVYWPMVQFATDLPLHACLFSQYAGWEVKEAGYSAMGSGPMRAIVAEEALFRQFEYAEQFSCTVGILEADRLPTAQVVKNIAAKTKVEPRNLMLLVAPTSSLAGALQINARSVETALHKLHELKFDVRRIVSATGISPLSPVASNLLEAIGRTNDAILYGAQVTLYVTGDDASIEEVGSQTPSATSSDYGKPFVELFRAVNCNFYEIDPLLFSPAQVVFQNIETGRVHRFGETNQALLEASFGLQPRV